jgi:hypothetical protein
LESLWGSLELGHRIDFLLVRALSITESDTSFCGWGVNGGKHGNPRYFGRRVPLLEVAFVGVVIAWRREHEAQSPIWRRFHDLRLLLLAVGNATMAARRWFWVGKCELFGSFDGGEEGQQTWGVHRCVALRGMRRWGSYSQLHRMYRYLWKGSIIRAYL